MRRAKVLMVSLASPIGNWCSVVLIVVVLTFEAGWVSLGGCWCSRNGKAKYPH